MHEGTDRPRIPGVRYEKVTRTRPETTVIDGQAETREVEFDEWVPVPPRDWDLIVLRAVTAVAVVVTLLAVSGTTASIGGLLDTIVPALIAYSIAAIFDVSWLVCIAVEWLERFDPDRARIARNCGWVALGISMGTVIAFGHHHEETVAGIAGAAVSLLAKGLCALVLRYYAVPLSPGVAFWLRRRREKIAARMAVSAQLRRLNTFEAYAQAAFGPEANRAEAITTGQAGSLPSGQRPDNADTPVPPVSGQVPAQPAPGQRPDTQDTAGTDTSGQGQDSSAPPVPPVSPIAGGSIAATIRSELTKNPQISDDSLTARVAAVHGERKNLAETVRRTRGRIETHKKKRTAS
ncbi:hypothetical protein [Streptomyces sp. NPDC053560]|uniref:hypothetical protein n=1 Tax=Streptomyces sp. NPDC053560 TaxID=3365711 RepID=UPI0037CF27AD